MWTFECIRLGYLCDFNAGNLQKHTSQPKKKRTKDSIKTNNFHSHNEVQFECLFFLLHIH